MSGEDADGEMLTLGLTQRRRMAGAGEGGEGEGVVYHAVERGW